MASVVPWFPRLALHDCEIEGFASYNLKFISITYLINKENAIFIFIFPFLGYKIKKGWNINVDARSVHLDPNVYDDPDKFIPSRFDVSYFQKKSCFYLP